jgi:glycosyltransferase involved in cell wall biosynthesis
MESKKISILMPCYNDEKFLAESIQSIVNQTYCEWELIVIDDGSTDKSKDIIHSFIGDSRINYLYQENADQLNALLHGARYISGQFVFVHHSDDVLGSDDVFQIAIEAFSADSSIEGVYGNIEIIDAKSEQVRIDSKKFFTNKAALRQLSSYFLFQAGNILYDTFFVRVEVFNRLVLPNYVTWNLTYWIDYSTCPPHAIKLKKINCNVFKYRIIPGDNYKDNTLGILNVLSGNFRSIFELSKHFSIPFPQIQAILGRVIKKFIYPAWSPFYFKRRMSNKQIYNGLKRLVLHKAGNRMLKNPVIESQLAFYNSVSSRSLFLNIPSDVKIYFGKDMRLFNQNVLAGRVEEFYLHFLNEMKLGFQEVVVTSQSDFYKASNILKFFCISAQVRVALD